jgi:hypothetical protein
MRSSFATVATGVIGVSADPELSVAGGAATGDPHALKIVAPSKSAAIRRVKYRLATSDETICTSITAPCMTGLL